VPRRPMPAESGIPLRPLVSTPSTSRRSCRTWHPANAPRTYITALMTQPTAKRKKNCHRAGRCVLSLRKTYLGTSSVPRACDSQICLSMSTRNGLQTSEIGPASGSPMEAAAEIEVTTDRGVALGRRYRCDQEDPRRRLSSLHRDRLRGVPKSRSSADHCRHPGNWLGIMRALRTVRC